MKRTNLLWICIIFALAVIIGITGYLIRRSVLDAKQAEATAPPDEVLTVSEADDASSLSESISVEIQSAAESSVHDPAADSPEAAGAEETPSGPDSAAEGTAAPEEILPASSDSQAVPAESTSEEEPMIPAETIPEESSAETAPPADLSALRLTADEPPQNYTYDLMMEDIARLASAAPELMKTEIIGYSLDQRAITEITIGDPDADVHVLLQYTIHGRESLNSVLCIRQLKDYLQKQTEIVWNGKTMAEAFAGVQFHIIPMSNPDGVLISELGPDAIRNPELRKGLDAIYENDMALGKAESADTYWARWKANARGVDLNRNFDAGWDTFEGSSAPSFDRYKGTAPASEPETQAILSLKDKYPTAACISYHSSGSLIYWDYGCEGSVYEADRALVTRVEAVTGYSPSSSVTSSQDAAGCSDYFVLVLGIPAVTIETGRGTCPLSIDEISGIYRENLSVWPAIAELYGTAS